MGPNVVVLKLGGGGILLFPTGHLEKPGNMFGCYDFSHATGIWWLDAGDAAKYSPMPTRAPNPDSELFAPRGTVLRVKDLGSESLDSST